MHTHTHTHTPHSTYSAYRVLDITPSRIFVIILLLLLLIAITVSGIGVYRFILGTGFGTIEFPPPFFFFY